MGILVTSTITAIAANVAIYLNLSKLYEMRKADLIGPPIPIIPCKNPDRLPPIIVFISLPEPENQVLKMNKLKKLKEKPLN